MYTTGCCFYRERLGHLRVKSASGTDKALPGAEATSERRNNFPEEFKGVAYAMSGRWFGDGGPGAEHGNLETSGKPLGERLAAGLGEGVRPE